MYHNVTRPAPNAPGELHTRPIQRAASPSSVGAIHESPATMREGATAPGTPLDTLAPRSFPSQGEGGRRPDEVSNSELASAAEQLAAAAKLVLAELNGSPQEGWNITSDVTRDRVYVYIRKGSRVIGSGFSCVRTNRPNTDAEMAQCFSYAAHQAYKNAQWREEFGHE